ncbi:MAG: hypothetical protein IV100_04510 [Myxococcales bacterium]|nr:hypothetical protein [Myxococcales bacterium]
MDIHYHEAIISYREDLTDPDAVSWPIASFIAADVGGVRWLTLAGKLSLPPAAKADPFIGQVLSRMPQTLSRQVGELISRHGMRAPLEDLVGELILSMRNTIHVSAVAFNQTLHLDDTSREGVKSSLVKLATDALQRSCDRAPSQSYAPTPRHTEPVFDVPAVNAFYWDADSYSPPQQLAA